MIKSKNATYAVMATVEGTIEHEYNIKMERGKKHVKYSLYYSEASFWSGDTRGSLIMTCKDDGNKVDMKFAEETSTGSMEYYDIEHIFVMIKFMKRADDLKCKYKFKKIK